MTYVADELAVAMAAAAEAALPDAGVLQEAHAFAAAVWERFSSHLLDAKDKPQFVHLTYQLGMKELAVCIANRLKVCTH